MFSVLLVKSITDDKIDWNLWVCSNTITMTKMALKNTNILNIWSRERKTLTVNNLPKSIKDSTSENTYWGNQFQMIR